jgi:hypothetical protein
MLLINQEKNDVRLIYHLNLANSINVPVSEVSLYAEFLDVYKSTAGV